MSTALAGLAFTATQPTADDRGRGADDANDAPDDSDGRHGGGHGSDG
jgi:hypothetical protein